MSRIDSDTPQARPLRNCIETDCACITQPRCVVVVFNHIVCLVSPLRLTPSVRATIRLGLVAAVMAATGIVCAAIVGLGAGYAISDRHFGFGALGIVIAAVMIGYPVGAIAGLLLLRRKPGVPGSLPLGLIGCVIGAILPVVVTGALNLVMEPSVLFTVYFVSVPALGAFGYLHHAASHNASPPHGEKDEGR